MECSEDSDDNAEKVMDVNLKKCIQMLKNSKTDNEKFAAMLMVAKTTKSGQLKKDEKESLLDAIGLTFMLRLLKSNKGPEDCPSHIYKSISLSILSGLCPGTDLVSSVPLFQLLKPINEILLQTDSDEDDHKTMMDDCYEILQVFCIDQSGIEQLLDNGTMAVISHIIVSQSYGCDKAQDLLTVILHTVRPSVWEGQEEPLTSLLNYFAQKMELSQDQEKFEICSLIGMLLRVTPYSLFTKADTTLWHKSLVKAMQDIFTSKLGEAQREPSLKLIATLVDRVGMGFVLPPNMKDNKVLLIIIHLSCIEVRMTLENLTFMQIVDKADLLCACYHLLENVIIYLTTSPSLLLDEKQILQLHSAMLGAFHSIIFFLKEISDENNVKNQFQNPVVIATVRVLGAWLAEETSAMRAKTYEILPFLLQLCKLQMEHSQIYIPEEDSCPEETPDAISSKLTDLEVTEMNGEERLETVAEKTPKQGKIDVIPDNSSEDKTVINKDSHAPTDPQSNHETLLHSGISVDLLRFILPGLCHLTTEDEPRKILIDNDLLSMLKQYFQNVMKKFLSDFSNDVLMKGLEIVCNIFLNLAVLEPNLVTENDHLQKVSVIVVQTVPLLGAKSELISLWIKMLAVGMFFLRHQSNSIRETTSEKELVAFFSSVSSFVKNAFTNSSKNRKREVLCVSPEYLIIWEEASQLWFLSIQAMTACIPLYPEMMKAVLSSGLMPHLSKILIAVQELPLGTTELLKTVQGRDVGDEVKKSILTLLFTMATSDQQAKKVIKSTGGLQLAKMYNSKELRTMLESDHS